MSVVAGASVSPMPGTMAAAMASAASAAHVPLPSGQSSATVSRKTSRLLPLSIQDCWALISTTRASPAGVQRSVTK